MPAEQTIELFNFPGMCGRVALTALEQAGADYVFRIVDYFSEASRQTYKDEVNPTGKFPSARIGGQVMVENAAIILYIADRYPDAGLFPATDDPLQAWLHRADMIHCAATLHPVLTRARSPQRIIDGHDQQIDVRAKAADTLCGLLRPFDDRLGRNGGFLSGSWSIIDSYLGWIHWVFSQCEVDLSSLPNFRTLCDRLDEWPAHRRALSLEAAAMAEAGIILPS